MKILFAVSNENVSNRIVDSYKKRFQDTVSFKNVFYFNAIIRELQRDKSYDSIVLSEDLEPFANSNYDVIDKFIVERMQEVAEETKRIGKDIGIIVICTDRRTKNSYVLNKLYEYGIYNALVGADRRIDNVCSLINTPRTIEEAKEYYNIQEDELGNNLDDVSEQEVQNILIHYKKLGKNEERYTDSFNNIASQYNDKQLRIIIKCLPINVRAVLEAECPKYQELVTSQDETEEERIQKERIQEERKIEKEENDKKLQAKIEKERREAEKRALKEQKAAEKAAARENKNAQAQNLNHGDAAPEIPAAPRTEGMPTNTVSVGSQAAENSVKSTFATPKINTAGGSTGIDLLDNKKKEPRMTGNVIIPGNMNIRNERKIYSDDELNNVPSSPREPISGNEQIPSQEVASPISVPENIEEVPNAEVQINENTIPEAPQVELPQEEIPEATLPGFEEQAQTVPTEPQMQEPVLPGFEEQAPAVPTEPQMQEPVLPGFEEQAQAAPTEPQMQEAVLPGFEEQAQAVPTEPQMQEPVLPGFEEQAPAVPTEPQMQEPVLPGFEEQAQAVPTEPQMQEPVLPGFEEQAQAVPTEPQMQEPTLPGMEEQVPAAPTEQPMQEATLPGMEEIENPIIENAVQGPILPGFEIPASSVQNDDQADAVLPGFEQPKTDSVLEENTISVEEPPTMNNMHVPDLSNVEDILNAEGKDSIPVEFKDIEIPEPSVESEITSTNVEQPATTQIEQSANNVTEEVETATEEMVEGEEKKRGRGRPRKYPVAPPKPKGKRGRPRKYPLPGETENTDAVENVETADVVEAAEEVTVPVSEEPLGVNAPNMPQVQETVAPVVQPETGKMIIQTPTGPIEVEKQAPEEETNNLDGFEDVKVSDTYVEKVTADNIVVPEENIQVEENQPIQPTEPQAVLPGLEPVVPEPQVTVTVPESQTTVVAPETEAEILPGFEQPTSNDQQPNEVVAESTMPVEPITPQPIPNQQLTGQMPEQTIQQPTVNPFEEQIQTTTLDTNTQAPIAEPEVPKTTQEAVASVVPVNDLFEEVQTVQLSSSNTVNQNNVEQPVEPQVQTPPIETQIPGTPNNQVPNAMEQTQVVNPVETIQEPVINNAEQVQVPVQNITEPIQPVENMVQPVQPVQPIDNLVEQVQPAQPVENIVEQVQPVQQVENIVEPVQPTEPVEQQPDQMEAANLLNDLNNNINDATELSSANVQANVETSIDSQFEDIAGPQISNEPIEPIGSQFPEMGQSLDSSNIIDSGMNNNPYEDNNDEFGNYEDLYASTVSSKRLQADSNNPQNNVEVEQNNQMPGIDNNYQNANYQNMDQTQNNIDSNYGMGPQIEANPQVQAYVPNDNRMESIQALEDNRAYSTGTLSQVLTKDKKIVAFVGAPKSGTSFLVNNLANLFSSLGIRTAILDMTRNKNSYFIYTNNDENLRNTAYNCIENLENGIADGIKVDRNLDVYTAVPNDGKDYSNAETILSTLIQNESLVLIDCDFTTPWGYFANASEIYLVQSMDILTIQPLTGFLRELKTRGLLEQDKLRVVINKELKVKGLSSKVIIGGMSFYNDPAMSFMTELFNKDRIKACSIPFDDNVYSKYLEQIVNCQITISGYPKVFMNNLKILGNMVYPLLSKQTYSSNNSGGQNYGNSYGNQGYGNNFSPEMNNTLNQMRNKY